MLFWEKRWNKEQFVVRSSEFRVRIEKNFNAMRYALGAFLILILNDA